MKKTCHSGSHSDVGHKNLRIINGYRKIASVNHVDVFVGPTRECEAWQKIIRRLVLRKICTKGKNHK
ncbi:hypothetical protein T06_16840 [Trichinella sp. T6]|nr:hypothetical protein T06_16840 [Trichinella sp. T6]